MMPARFWELGAGMLLAMTAPGWTGYYPRHRGAQAAALVLAALAIGFGLTVRLGGAFPFPHALLPVAGAALLLVHVTALPSSLASRILSSAVPVWIGRISYSLYLWHWPVFTLFRRTAGLESVPLVLAALAVSFAAAELSYRFVEQPFRRRAAPPDSSGRTEAAEPAN